MGKQNLSDNAGYSAPSLGRAGEGPSGGALGQLFLLPVTLGDTPLDQVLPPHNKEVILGLRHFIVEEVRTARRFLKLVDKDINIDSLTFYPMGKHADKARFQEYLRPLSEGHDMGILSEAGCPAIADPGSDIVALAQKAGIRVVPLVGPSSILLSLMASGMNGQKFAFHGYLPIGAHERLLTLRRMEDISRAQHQTQLFIETPYRNHQMIDDIIQALHPHTRLCIAAGITTGQEYIRTLTLREWKQQKATLPDLKKIPTIFLISAK